jgi:hypothetical protein
MGLLKKTNKKKKAKSPSLMPCDTPKSWIKFHIFDATPTVEADFGNLGLTISNLNNIGRTLRTADGTGKVEEKFERVDGTYDVVELVNPVNDYVYFATDVSEA